MSEQDNSIVVEPPAGPGAAGRRRLTPGWRRVAGVVFIVGVVAAAVVAVARDRKVFFDSYHRLGIGFVVAAFALGLVGLMATCLEWRALLHGLGARLPLRTEVRLFFVSQLGKYAPGAVWPALMQMESGRAYNASRTQMLSANLMTIIISCVSGLIVACATLPFYAAGVLGHFWWLLLLIPPLAILVHPKSLPALLNLALRVLKRPPVDQSLTLRAELEGAGWALVAWLAFGFQVTLISSKTAGGVDASLILLSVGGMALAASVGVLAVPVPAGAGVREVVLVLILSRAMPAGQALAVAVASRVLLTLGDVALAAVIAPVRSRAASALPPVTANRDLKADDRTAT